MNKSVITKCKKCGAEVTLNFGEMTYVEARKAVEKMNNQSRECPGFHYEIGGWNYYWGLRDAVDAAYSHEEKKSMPDALHHIEIAIKSLNIGVDVSNEDEAISYLKSASDTLGDKAAETETYLRYMNYSLELIGDYTETLPGAIKILSDYPRL